MFVGKGIYKRHCNDQILEYCKNDKCCRREFLYSKFSSYSPNELISGTCKCCDVCSVTCKLVSYPDHHALRRKGGLALCCKILGSEVTFYRGMFTCQSDCSVANYCILDHVM